MTVRLEALLFAGLYYIVIIGTGLNLSRAGKPHRGVVLAGHKLVAIVTLGYLVITAVAADRTGRIDLAGWVAFGFAGLLFLATIASGAALSMDRPASRLASQTHRLTPVLVVLTSGVALLMLR